MASNASNWKSTIGYVFTFTGGAISWVSQLQKIVAEYVATTKACKKAIWLQRLGGDLGIDVEIPLIHCDNQSVI
eukprot:c37081_g1_i1 orf=177-398(+)